MTPGHCALFEEPDWVDRTRHEERYEAVATDDGACFIDTGEEYWKCWIESDLTIPLGDAL